MAYDDVRHYLVGVVAGDDLSADQHKFVKVHTNGKILLADSDVLAVGVLMNKPSASGQAASVAIMPSIVKLLVGETIVAGDKVMSDTGGLAATATTGKYVKGIALEDGAVGSLVTVQLVDQGRLA